MSLVSERGDRRCLATVSVVALALIALMALAQRAQAAENIYWDNYDANSISFADIGGAGGGALSLAGATLQNPEGMAYDSVTNRLFVASSGDGNDGAIIYVNLDGSGAGVFSAPGAPVEVPLGVAVDPANRTLYWVNGKEGTNTIGWARLDGSAGGTLNTAGTTVENPYKLAVDPVNGKVYWANTKSSPFTIAFANADNSGGGGTLNLSGATAPSTLRGIAVDPAGGRVYWLTANEERISYASIGGGNGGDINLAGSEFFDSPYGLAFDPSISRLYWANYSHGTERTNALGFTGLTGGAGGISPSTAPVDGPQDPIIIKSPSGTGAPVITRDAKNRPLLNCPTGSWGADYAGSFVYQAPRTFAYQWTRNGAAVPGATAVTFTATQPGSYACAVTATNQVGSAAQTSAPVNVKAAKVKLTTKKKAKADAGDLVTFKVKAVNQGDLAPKKNAKLCVKLPKAAKDDLRAPKCKKLGVKGGAKKTLTLKVKVKPAADEGTDKLTFQVKGSAGKAAKSKIVVR